MENLHKLMGHTLRSLSEKAVLQNMKIPGYYEEGGGRLSILIYDTANLLNGKFVPERGRRSQVGVGSLVMCDIYDYTHHFVIVFYSRRFLWPEEN